MAVGDTTSELELLISVGTELWIGRGQVVVLNFRVRLGEAGTERPLECFDFQRSVMAANGSWGS